MTALSQWNPFAEMDALQNRLSSFSDYLPVRNGHQTPVNGEWAPLIDVIETGDEYLIRADLPGVRTVKVQKAEQAKARAIAIQGE